MTATTTLKLPERAKSRIALGQGDQAFRAQPHDEALERQLRARNGCGSSCARRRSFRMPRKREGAAVPGRGRTPG